MTELSRTTDSLARLPNDRMIGRQFVWRHSLCHGTVRVVPAFHCTVWVKKSPLRFSEIFSQTVGNF